MEATEEIFDKARSVLYKSRMNYGLDAIEHVVLAIISERERAIKAIEDLMMPEDSAERTEAFLQAIEAVRKYQG
jgi:hypothetical protein